MSTSFVKILQTNDDRWAVESEGERVPYASRVAAISAGVHKAIQENAFLMIYEGEADARMPIDLCGIDLPNDA